MKGQNPAVSGARDLNPRLTRHCFCSNLLLTCRNFSSFYAFHHILGALRFLITDGDLAGDVYTALTAQNLFPEIFALFIEEGGK
jgi:hypothetical protein